jgi:ribosomal protein S27E
MTKKPNPPKISGLSSNFYQCKDCHHTMLYDYPRRPTKCDFCGSKSVKWISGTTPPRRRTH